MSTDAPITNDDLQAFADNALTPARRVEVAAYLQNHREAAQYVEQIVAQNATLRAAAAPLLEPEVPSSLRVARLFECERAKPSPSRPWSWRNDLSAMWRPQIAAVLLVGLAIGGIGGWSFHPSGSPFHSGVRPLVEEAADTYAVFEPDRLHPVEISATDKDALMRWIANRLGRPIAAPDTIRSFGLLGGRVVPTSHGPAAMFMYEATGGQRVVLMICPLSMHGTAPLTASEQGKLTGISWSDQGVGYSLIGTLPSDALRQLGEDIRRHETDKA